MKKLRLGLVAVAMLGALGAFAVNSEKNGWYEPDEVTQFQGNPDLDCQVPETLEICALHFTDDELDDIRYEIEP